MAGTKFTGLAPRLLLLSVAALIMLSAAVVTEDVRQCYWCGPLAEQVHRSQRAPACDAPGNQVTNCDPGLPYCAIVATSPPYVESRYCVKSYREECYPLFCNSSRTWKMMCPCKESLCNGPNTERERKAFATLTEIVEKNQNKRITKRTGQPAVQFIKPRTEKSQIIANTSGIQENLLNGTFEDSNEIIREQLTEIIFYSEPVVDIRAGNVENDMESTENYVTPDNTEDTTVDDIKTTELESDKQKVLSPTTTNGPELITNIQKPTVMNRIDDTPKPSEELPTAEALQQNASPIAVTEKTTPTTTLTYESTTLTTTESVETTTEQHVHKKNRGIKINSSVYMIIVTYIYVQFFAL